MNRWFLALACIVPTLSVGAVATGESVSLLASRTFTRSTGTPTVETVSFLANAGEYVVTITSPAPGFDVPATSASVWLDQVLLAGPDVFKASGTSRAFVSAGTGTHQIAVRVAGKPGATVAVDVTQAHPCFVEDFSTNPLTNGKWTDFSTDVRGPGGALIWDEANERFVLADGSPTFGNDWGFGGSMWADYELPDSGWTAELDYWVGGGTAPGGLSPSDGLLLAFNAEPVPGGVNGYFVFLDNFRNSWDPDTGFVGLYYINQPPAPWNLPNRLDWVDDGRGRDAQWHHLKIDVEGSRVRVYIDDMVAPILDDTISEYDLSRKRFGLLGLSRTDDILVDNVTICPR